MRSFGKTYFKTFVREIRDSFGRFFALFGIVTLGVGFLSGLLATTPDMKASMDRYFDERCMMDLLIKGTAGLTGDDEEALEKLGVVEKLLPAFVTDVPVKTSSVEVLTARIYGLPMEHALEKETINRFELVKGRMPERDGECLVQEAGGYLKEFLPGSRLEILPEKEDATGTDLHSDRVTGLDGGETYRVTEFTVTGIVKSPLFISYEREPSGAGDGRLGAVLFVRQECYALPVYTDFFITLKGAREKENFTEAYQKLVDEAAKKIEETGETRAFPRQAEIKDLALKRLEEAEREYQEGREKALSELEAARRRLEEAARGIQEGEEELLEGENEIIRGKKRLAEEKKQVTEELRTNEAALREGEREIVQARQALADAKARLDAARPEVEKTRNSRLRMSSARAREGVAQFDAAWTAWEAGVLTVNQKTAELLSGRRALEEGRRRADREFTEAEEALLLGEADIVKGRERLALGKEELARGQREYEEGRLTAEEALGEAERKIGEGKRKFEDYEIPLGKWYVLDRNANVGAINYNMNSEKIADLSNVFPLFFLLVAALVALTTMTRMVEEERPQFGTLKALGYRKRDIAAKYLFYCGLTGILGSAAGMVLGFRLLPIIIYRAFGTRYHLPPLVTLFNWHFGLIACGLVLTAIMGATIAACYASLREKPAALMLPRAPKPGKRIFLERITFLWAPMKFTYKVSARNLLRYKKHFFMTITGISGCTALMLTGFGLRDSMVDIARTQFSQVLKYDLRMEMRENWEEDESLLEFLEQGGGKPMLPVRFEQGYLVSGRERYGVQIVAPGEGEIRIGASRPGKPLSSRLGEFISLKNRRLGKAVDFNADSAVVTEKTAELLNLKDGDSITVEDSSGNRRDLTITGITENYVGSFLYLGENVYRDLTGADPLCLTLLVKTGIKKP
ncbi:MAG: FtsX-like permease family protein, partial [Treponema sp.]|nr:FtsX-like permease family protein [Treponema sp.]